jgi:hypothetical protein
VNPLLALIHPLLQALDIDPAKLANRLGREQLQRRMERGIPAVARDLTAHGLTPEKVAGDPSLSRQMVRSAMYSLFKRALALRHGGNVISDLLRDTYDDAVVARVVPWLSSGQTAEEALALIVRETAQQIF